MNQNKRSTFNFVLYQNKYRHKILKDALEKEFGFSTCYPPGISVTRVKMRGSKRNQKKEEDEVEQMLRAAQDEILLNLSLNSYLSRPSPSSSSTIFHPDPDLDLDLDRRFQALKVNSKNQQPLDPSTRFDALKAKLHQSVNANDVVSASEPPFRYEESDEEDEEAQIQKLIEWAKDAARLDPSPPSPAVSDDEDDEPAVSDDGDHEDDDHRKSLK